MKLKLPNNYYQFKAYWADLLTLRCNGNCPYCILDRRGRHVDREFELSGREKLEWWNNLDHPNGWRLSIIGGEPTLHPDFVEVINNLDGYRITMTTNCKGPFYTENERFWEVLKPQPGSSLRVNTTFHPHHMRPEEYIEVIEKWRRSEHFVDQTSYVGFPEYPYMDEIKKVAEVIDIYESPYMGFWSHEEGFDAEPSPETNEMDESYHDLPHAARLCAITDYPAYRDICAQKERKRAECWQPMMTLIVDPEGDLYGCHNKLYWKVGATSNIKDFRPVTLDDMTCDYYGWCNHCDMPRILCVENPTARPIPECLHEDRVELHGGNWVCKECGYESASEKRKTAD